MVKKILITLGVLILIAAIGFGAWWFFLRPTPLKGDINNASAITLNLHDNIFYDVLIPNEAVLEETDEHYTYEYDLLRVGVRDTEPLDADYRVQVDGRWVYAYSEDDWLKTVAYSVENNKPYEVVHEFEYLTTTDPETGEEVKKDWACGPAPYIANPVGMAEPGVIIYGPGDYLIYKEQYGQYNPVCNLMADQLVQSAGQYMPEYYQDGRVFYAAKNGVTVGVVGGTFNTQYTVFAKGQQATELALSILVEGVG